MKLFLQFAICLFVVAFCMGLVKGYLDLPTVHYSHSKQRIVAVEYADGGRVKDPSPEQVPKKYSMIQVR